MRTEPDSRQKRVLWRLAALVAYPVLVWSAVGFGAEWLRAVTLPLLALAVIGGLPGTVAASGLFAASLVLALATLLAPDLALWPAGLVCLGMAVWFALSLAGREPLIRRFAAEICRQAGRVLPPDSDTWFRRWTLTWSVLLAALGAGAVTLAILGRPEIWLIWVSGVIPVSCAIVFMAEFFLRPLRFPGEARWGLVQFITHLMRVRPGHLAR